jgi:hypothetical protein
MQLLINAAYSLSAGSLPVKSSCLLKAITFSLNVTVVLLINRTNVLKSVFLYLCLGIK